MCKKHLTATPILEKISRHSATRILSVFLFAFFSVLSAQAQKADSTKIKKKPTATIHKKTDSTHRAVIQVKKDTTHQHQVLKSKPVTSVRKDSSVHRKPVVVNTPKKDSTNRKKIAAAPIQTKPKDSTAQHRPIAQKQHSFTRKSDPLWEKTISVPYLPLKAKPIYVMDQPHPYKSKDMLFFVVCGLLLLYGIVRTAFPKYTDSLFKNLISFSSIDKNDYNMGQNNLPSLLLNLLFCLSTGMLATLILEQSHTLPYAGWEIWLFGSLVLAIIYMVKSLTIYVSGWIFNAAEDANAYMYVVFLVNKIIGLLCLPAILVFAFAESAQLNQNLLTIGSILLIMLLLYRYLVSFSVIARNLQLNAFHFFLYLCSVEIVPILILYKLFFKDLTNWIG